MIGSRDRLKQTELLSGIGAGLLGAGIALPLAPRLGAFWIPVVLVGVAVHGWAMYEKRRLERDMNERRQRWEELAYWGCWAALLGLLAYVASAIFS